MSSNSFHTLLGQTISITTFTSKIPQLILTNSDTLSQHTSHSSNTATTSYILNIRYEVVQKLFNWLLDSDTLQARSSFTLNTRHTTNASILLIYLHLPATDNFNYSTIVVDVSSQIQNRQFNFVSGNSLSESGIWRASTALRIMLAGWHVMSTSLLFSFCNAELWTSDRRHSSQRATLHSTCRQFRKNEPGASADVQPLRAPSAGSARNAHFCGIRCGNVRNEHRVARRSRFTLTRRLMTVAASLNVDHGEEESTEHASDEQFTDPKKS